MKKSIVKIAITGGIASGKSTVSALLEQYGLAIVDLDVLAQEVVSLGSVGLNALVEVFGQAILNDNHTLNRDTLRDLMFENDNNKQQIEAILHPLIIAKMQSDIDQLDTHTVFVIVPLLLEANMLDLFDKVVVVDCPLQTQKNRLAKRNGFDEALINKILASQASQTQRLAIKNAIIINNQGNLSTLKQQVISLINIIV